MRRLAAPLQPTADRRTVAALYGEGRRPEGMAAPAADGVWTYSSFDDCVVSLLLFTAKRLGLRPRRSRVACARTVGFADLRVKAHYAGRTSADDRVQRAAQRRWGCLGAYLGYKK